MDQREKLIELLLNNPKANGECFITMCNTDCKYYESDHCYTEMLADYLLANGVVVLPCRCCECINRHNELICPMVISHESFDEDDGYDVWYEDLTTDDFYCAYAKRKGGDE